MNKTEVKGQFKNNQVHKVLDIVLEDVENFEFEKGFISGHSINVWRIEPVQDEGSFLYYENEEARNHDWDLLMTLIEAVQ
jgi:hypothetical protein